MSKPEQYTVSTVQDIANIPEEHLSQFFAEFLESIRMHNALREIEPALGPMIRFTWINDGKLDITAVVLVECAE